MGQETIAARLGLQGAQAALLDHFEAQGGLLHKGIGDIGKATGFSVSAVSQALQRLRGKRLIWIDGYQQIGGRGKPIPVYRLNDTVIAVLLSDETGALGQELAEAYAEEGRT